MKKAKLLKDYGLIRYFAKSNKSYMKAGEKGKDIGALFAYGEANVYVQFSFKNKVASRVVYDVKEIYDQYVTEDEYPNAEEFGKAFCEKYPYYDYEGSAANGGFVFVSCDLTLFNEKKSVSQGFFNLGIFIHCMDEMLNVKGDKFTEKDIRQYNLHYLSKERKHAKLFAFLGLAAFVLGLVLTIVSANGDAYAGIFFSILLMLAGIGAAIFFFVRFRYFNYLFKKARV